MEDARYRIPAGWHRVEQELQKSRFVTTLAPAPTPEAARAFIARVREEFADATHNCWAFVVGPPGSTSQVGMSDDGEPHGTAGRPMLTALLHGGVGDIAAVVTRFYGGILLGKGGLVRAYTGGVQLGLSSLPTAERVEKVRVGFHFDYGAIDSVRRLLPAYEAALVEEEYGGEVRYGVELPASRREGLVLALRDATSGDVRLDAE